MILAYFCMDVDVKCAIAMALLWYTVKTVSKVDMVGWYAGGIHWWVVLSMLRRCCLYCLSPLLFG